MRRSAFSGTDHFSGLTHASPSASQTDRQLDKLRRWNSATEGREMRMLELKREVNELLGKTGQSPRYPSAESDEQQGK